MVSTAPADEIEEKCGPLVKWLRQRPLTPLTSVRIRYGSPFLTHSRTRVFDLEKEELTATNRSGKMKLLRAEKLLT